MMPSRPRRGFSGRGPPLRAVAALIITIAGAVLMGQAAWIHVKARVAQVLLEQAFARSIATGAPVKPWSWADTWPVARIEVRWPDGSTQVLTDVAADQLLDVVKS